MRKEGLDEDLGKLKKYLQEEGKGKHVLIDEVPITLGFQKLITAEDLSKHWEWIVDMIPSVKSITISFRPNDQSYTRDFPIQDVMPGGYQVTVLEAVKRNSRNVAELFLAIGDYSRRIFISLEKTLPLQMEQSGKGFLPVLFPIPSCFSIHPGKCKDEKVCEAVRAAHAIRIIYEKHSKSSEKIPIFVVVDHERRKNALVNIFVSDYPSITLFLYNSHNHQVWKFRKKKALNVSNIPIVVATESEIIGCHLKSVTVVIDFAQSEWQNYVRLIAATGEKKILVIEEEQLRIGKFSRIKEKMTIWDISERSFNEDLKERLEKAWQECDTNKIDYLKEEDFSSSSFPGINIDREGRDGKEEGDVDLMLGRLLSGIFGPSASGKSRRVDLLISRTTQKKPSEKARILLLHQGSTLSWIELRRRWKRKDNVDLDYASDSKITSLKDIIARVEGKMEEERKKLSSLSQRFWNAFKSKQERALIVVVEDCPLLKDLEESIERLKGMNIRLILVFKPHSENASVEAIQRTIEVLTKDPASTAIVLTSQPTNLALLEHIQKNETGRALKLEAKSLSVVSVPAAIVLGPPVQFFKCRNRHLGYICKGEAACRKSVAVASSLPHDALTKVQKHQAYILTSDKNMLTSLEILNTHPKIKVIPPENFRGCETSIVTAVDVSDDWLLEVISRSRNQLTIIDNIPNHEDLWKTMIEEHRVQTWDGPSSRDVEASRGIFLTLDEREKFLTEPTWNVTARRIGEEVLKKEKNSKRGGFLDRKTGKIKCLHLKTWETLDGVLPLPQSSSPFRDWGYAWDVH
ncbi:unnamed protein product [Darwinula stevensoni]|uniref:Uncharacterized protein n=1 Tax=Darwinula stevensoni TaxID=69355 RepID=A0A7R8XHP0_9CRUS|nr:unnamed protein product [Darwinula stevensoni]CAG0890594.1 unnamed protein product [Darwinula stevensoni]